VAPAQFFEIEAGTGHRPGRKVLHQHVGSGNQPREKRVIVRLLEVEDHRLLAAVEPYEIAALTAGGAVIAARKIAFRPLNFDDPRAGICEPTGAQRRCDRVFDGYDQHAFERPRHSFSSDSARGEATAGTPPLQSRMPVEPGNSCPIFEK